MDIDLLARALAAELHIDEEHGFPSDFTAEDLARLLVQQMLDIATTEGVQ